MGKGRPRHRNRQNKQREIGGGDRADARGWKKNENGEDLVIIRENTLFEKFYKAQQIVPEQEWSEFMETLKRDLPQAFRIVGGKKEGELLLQILKERYFCKISEVEIDGKFVEPPKPLSWYPYGLGFQICLPRRVLRKHALLNNLHNFLVTESELGHLSRQETVSMIPPLLLDIKSNSKIFDMCAAPGSKTAQLIEMLHGDDENEIPTGFVLANDENNKRCYLLVHQSLKRLNSPCCLVVNNDASIMPAPKILNDDDTIQSLKFDQILCDVPCSGDGTLRKNFAIWKSWSPYHGFNLHRLQIRIAKRGLEMLNVGGQMVYSTCSLNPAENEAVICYLLDFAKGAVDIVDVSDKLHGLVRSPGLHEWKLMDREGVFYEKFADIPESKHRYFPKTAFAPKPEIAEEYHLERCMRILPHQQDTGGFFVALLKKTKEFPWIKSNVPSKRIDIETIGRFPEQAGNSASAEQQSADSPDSPPRKQRRFKGYKEDPFVFLSADDSSWKAVESYFGIGPGFPNRQLLRRGQEENKKRNLYFVNDLLKRIIENNNDNMKLINAGLRLFSRIDVKESQSQIRLTQDGINILLPYITKRIVELSRDELIQILTKSKDNCYSLNQFPEETKNRFNLWDEGSVVLLCNYDSRKIAVCAWRGKQFVSPYLAKESVVHVLRMLHYDTTDIENEMINAKRRKQNDGDETNGKSHKMNAGEKMSHETNTNEEAAQETAKNAQEKSGDLKSEETLNEDEESESKSDSCSSNLNPDIVGDS